MSNNPQITAIVSAQDNASATLRAIADLSKRVANELEKAGKVDTTHGLAAATRAAEVHARAIDRIRDAFKGLSAAAAAYAAYKLPQLAGGAAHEGMALQHEEMQLRFAGIPDKELDAAKKQLLAIGAATPNVSFEHGLETYKELRSVLKDITEVPHMLPSVMKAKGVLDSADSSGGLSGGLAQLIKGAEIAGITNNPARFEKFLDSTVKALQVSGKTLTPAAIGEFLKYEKATGASLSDKYQMTTGLSLTQELGSSAGVATNQFVKQLLGGFQGNLHAAAKEFVSLGLARKDDFELTKTGEIKGMKPGRKLDSAHLAQTDPFEWVKSVFIPALEKHGFKDQESQLAEVRRAFPNSNAADLVSKLITQRETFENHAKLYEEAMGINADLTRDAATQLTGFNTSLKDLGAVVTSPLMNDAAGVLSALSTRLRGAIESYGAWSAKSPGEAKVVVAGGAAATIGTVIISGAIAQNFLKTLLGGAALDGSAVALTGAATALNAAAARLGATGALANVAKGAAGAGVVEGAGAAVVAGGGSFLAGGAVAAAGAGAIFLSEAALYGIMKGAVALGIVEPNHRGEAGHWEETGSGRVKTRRWLADDQFGPDHEKTAEEAASDWSRFEGKTHWYKGQPIFVADLSRPKEASTPAPAGWSDKPLASAPGSAFPNIGGPRALPAEMKTDVSVSGDVKGAVDLYQKVTFEPSPYFQALVEDMKKISIPISGNVGKTMGGSNGVKSPIGGSGFSGINTQYGG
jgi:hypothetical protein